MSGNLTCSEFEVLLADWLDGTLQAAQKAAVEHHRAGCAACDELVRDASGAVAFIERVAEVAPPPELVNRILRAGPRGGAKVSWVQTWLGRVLQPRLAMGLAMAMLSLALLGRFGAAAENGVYRAWDRTVKNYDSMALVYDVQTQWQEWRQASEPEYPGDPAAESK